MEPQEHPVWSKLALYFGIIPLLTGLTSFIAKGFGLETISLISSINLGLLGLLILNQDSRWQRPNLLRKWQRTITQIGSLLLLLISIITLDRKSVV